MWTIFKIIYVKKVINYRHVTNVISVFQKKIHSGFPLVNFFLQYLFTVSFILRTVYFFWVENVHIPSIKSTKKININDKVILL